MKYLLTVLVLCAVIGAPAAFGQQVQPVVLEPIPGVTQGNDFSFATMMRGLFQALLGLGAILAVLMLVIGGIQYMTGEALNTKEQAREKIRNAILGLLLLFGSVLILQTINPNLLQFKIFSSSAVIATL